MPLFKHPFNKTLSSPRTRLEMLKCLEKTRAKLSDLEIKKKTTSYTIDTLKSLTKKYPNDKLYWVIGADQIKDFDKWKGWKEILNKFGIVVIPRVITKKPEEGIKKLLPSSKNIVLIDKKRFPPVHASSTLIRERVKKGKSIARFVPKKIEAYIIRHKLYLQILGNKT